MMEAKKYNIRPGRRVDYKASNDIVLPVVERCCRPRWSARAELYPVEVLERDEETKRVKVHCTGHGNSDNEWKDESDVDLTQENGENDVEPQHLITLTFYLYQQLALRIKMSLQSSRKGNPEVRITMDFVKLFW